MILNKKLSKKTVAFSFTLITIFVVYVLNVAYGMQKAIDYYHATVPEIFYD